ncbi:MAG: HD domain-containing phosphohydrolase [Candidatus Xenobiia bacterium LiM19]
MKMIPALLHSESLVIIVLIMFLTLMKSRKREMFTPFMLAGSSLFIWHLGSVLALHFKEDAALSFFWARVSLATMALFASSAGYYILTALGRSRLFSAAVYLPGLAASALVPLNATAAGLQSTSHSLTLAPGPLFPVYTILWLAPSIISIAALLRESRKISTEYGQVFIPLCLGAAAAVSGALDFFPVYGIPLPSTGAMLSLIGFLCLYPVMICREPMESLVLVRTLAGYAGAFIIYLAVVALLLLMMPQDIIAGMDIGAQFQFFLAISFFYVILTLLLSLPAVISTLLDYHEHRIREKLKSGIEEFTKDLSASYELEQFLNKTVLFLKKSFCFQKASFLLLDESRNMYRVTEGDPLGNPGLGLQRSDAFIQALEEYNDITTRLDLATIPTASGSREETTASFDKTGFSLFLPLSMDIKGSCRLIGIIALDSSSLLDFMRKKNRSTLELLLHRIIPILYQLVVKRRREEDLMILSRFKEKVVAADSPDVVLKNLVGTIRELMNVERVSVMLLDEHDHSRLIIKESFGIDPDIARTVSIDVADQKKVSAWVFQNKRALLADDVEQAFGAQDKTGQYSTKSLLSIPIIIEENAIGVINVNNKISDEPFDRVDLEILKGLANETSISMVSARMRQADRTRLENLVRTLAKTLEAKDPFTQGHADRVAEYAGYIASQMNLPFEKYAVLMSCGILHDVGKISIPDSVLLKPGKLTDEEFAIIKGHSKAGEEILRQAHISDEILNGVRHHHERYDGKGYPDGLKGDTIPLLARILAVADAFDAMMSNRAYRKKMKFKEVKEQIVKNRGTQFDPVCADMFLQWLDENAPPDEEDIDKIELDGSMQQRKFGDPVK